MSRIPRNAILHGDALEMLRTLPDNSIHSCISSPPYWNLRDYGVPGQIGLEATPEEWCARLVEVFREVRRVLRPDGTFWCNVGDAYAGSWGAQSRGNTTGEIRSTLQGSSMLSARQIAAHPQMGHGTGSLKRTPGCKPKDLIGLPWMLAFALRADGWWLRSDICWFKPNPMPESVQDRPSRAHEYIFLLTKSEHYFYDAYAVRTPAKEQCPTHSVFEYRPRSSDKQRGHSRRHAGFNDRWDRMSREEQQAMGANLRDVWTVATQPYPGSHFAVFPPRLIEPCVLAGCPSNACEHCGAPWTRMTAKVGEIKDRWSATSSHATAVGVPKGIHRERQMRALRQTAGWHPTCRCTDNTGGAHGICLDPFFGSGTVGVVCRRHGRDYLGIELNSAYVDMAEARIAKERQPVLWTAGVEVTA